MILGASDHNKLGKRVNDGTNKLLQTTSDSVLNNWIINNDWVFSSTFFLC